MPDTYMIKLIQKAVCEFQQATSIHSRVTRLIYMWHESLPRWYADFNRELPLIYVQSHVTWLIQMWHESFICDMTHSKSGIWVSRGSFLSLVVCERWGCSLVRCSVPQHVAVKLQDPWGLVSCNVLQYVAASIAACCGVCSMLHCVVVYCSVL